MRTPPWKDWPAQAPSEGFASRTVDALLREDKKVVPLRRRRRWFVVLGCAAALAGGTSWAMMRYMKEPQTAVMDVPEPESVPSAETPTVRFVATRADKIPSAPVAPPPAPVVRLPAAASATASASAPPPKILVVPRCNCEPGTQICACVH